MIVFLRFLGIANASVWCGAAVFTIIGLPALFSAEVKRLLTEQYVGFAAEAILGRYFILQYVCAAIALIHLLAEWLYLGRSVQRSTVWLLLGMTALGLIGGLGVQPKLRQLHVAKYWGQTVDRKVQAARSFQVLHAVSQSANLLVAGGLIVYLWRVSKSTENSRFVGLNKIRS